MIHLCFVYHISCRYFTARPFISLVQSVFTPTITCKDMFSMHSATVINCVHSARSVDKNASIFFIIFADDYMFGGFSTTTKAKQRASKQGKRQSHSFMRERGGTGGWGKRLEGQGGGGLKTSSRSRALNGEGIESRVGGRGWVSRVCV